VPLLLPPQPKANIKVPSNARAMNPDNINLIFVFLGVSRG